jgi:peptidoglycan/xylan/chitin deacetylase (PgdA/CDA1 family)
VVRQAGFQGMVMWSRSARDWKPQQIAQMVRRLCFVRGGDIVLLHDGDHRRFPGDRNLTLAGLDYWLPMWRSAGLDFVTLDDIASGKLSAPTAPSDSELSAPLTKTHASGN